MPDIPLLQGDTRDTVNNRYSNTRPKRSTNQLRSFSNPGQLLEKLCPGGEDAKAERRKAFLDGWKSLADSRQSADLLKISEELIKRRDAMVPTENSFTGKVVWRMVIGMSTPNPFETSITLHPQYGIPIIPGSTVKGLTRAWCLLTLASELCIYPLGFEDYRKRKFETETDAEGKTVLKRQANGKLKRRTTSNLTPMELLEELLLIPGSFDDPETQKAREEKLTQLKADSAVQAWEKLLIAQNEKLKESKKGICSLKCEEVFENPKAKLFLKVFGLTDQRGQVNFYDALPVEWNYKVDVMTPHYGDYYMDKKDEKGNPIPPADWLEPVPITFLTLNRGTKFRFDVRSSESGLVPIAKDWLKQAVSDLGVGGKTMTGYGEIRG